MDRADKPDPPPSPRRMQLHLVLPFKFQPRDHPRLRRHLEQGYRIVQLQRLTDREALVTLARTD